MGSSHYCGVVLSAPGAGDWKATATVPVPSEHSSVWPLSFSSFFPSLGVHTAHLTLSRATLGLSSCISDAHREQCHPGAVLPMGTGLRGTGTLGGRHPFMIREPTHSGSVCLSRPPWEGRGCYLQPNFAETSATVHSRARARTNPGALTPGHLTFLPMCEDGVAFHLGEGGRRLLPPWHGESGKGEGGRGWRLYQVSV